MLNSVSVCIDACLPCDVTRSFRLHDIKKALCSIRYKR